MAIYVVHFRRRSFHSNTTFFKMCLNEIVEFNGLITFGFFHFFFASWLYLKKEVIVKWWKYEFIFMHRHQFPGILRTNLITSSQLARYKLSWLERCIRGLSGFESLLVLRKLRLSLRRWSSLHLRWSKPIYVMVMLLNRVCQSKNIL